ncbi:RDD family protein [Kitasatospora sp. GP82]|uniref:RDD family protein n=1 Tax=Kitasatospora sp. GP82 TaxID=3035089 RepID=UPI0024732F26|nr:RDD family protein [Kitasatospora sp. GP82]MDH6127186.1 putative RDD family membrane protein YckC [Kitasatospora sp. GP82]
MSANEPSGHGYPTDPQNPYGQPPQGRPGYGPPQQPPPPPPGYGQQPYGTPPPPPPYGAPQAAWPNWLAAPGPYGGAPAPGTRTLASAGDRFLARLIDTGVLLVPSLLIFMVIGPTLFGYFVVGLINFGYEIAMLLTQGGQTVGKKAMKTRVVDLGHGGRPVDASLWIRAAVHSLPFAVYCIGALFWVVNVLWQLWDKPLQQCLHDKAAKTLVVKEA